MRSEQQQGQQEQQQGQEQAHHEWQQVHLFPVEVVLERVAHLSHVHLLRAFVERGSSSESLQQQQQKRPRLFLFGHLHLHLVGRSPMTLDLKKGVQRERQQLGVEKEKTWEVLQGRVVVVEKRFRCFFRL